MPDIRDLLDELEDEGVNAPRPWGKIAAIATIAVLVVGGLFWLFQVNATANSSQKAADDNAKRIEQKADKQDVKDGFEQINRRLDQIQDYLMNSPKK